MTEPAVADRSPGSPERDAHRLRTGIAWTVGLVVLLLAVGLAVPGLREVLERVAHASSGWLVLAVALELASCLGYVATVRLVLHRGPAPMVRRLAWAEMAFGAVVPVGGAGGLAVGAWAMRARGVSWSRVANRSAVIFLLTSAVNVTVLALAGLGVAAGVGARHRGIVYGLVPAGVALAAIAFFALLPRVADRTRFGSRQGRIGDILRSTATWVRDTEKIVLRGDWRVLGSVGYLIFDIAVLWACMRAIGVTPPLLALVVGYQVGYLANLVPIPGGVGALEGGLVGALVLYGLPAAPIAAAVIIYHAIALWVPVLGGTLGFVRLRAAVSAGPHQDAEREGDEAIAPAEASSLTSPTATAPAQAPGRRGSRASRR